MTSLEPDCPLCGGTPSGAAFPFGMVWNGRTFDYIRCSRCRSSFLSPLPTGEEFRLMYGQSAYHDLYYDDAAEEPVPSTLPAVRPMLKAGGRLLDFGCGNGAFLIAARTAGFESEGVELDEKAREQAAANSGCAVSAFEAVRAEGRRYDVIHLGDVLEHLPAPAQAMRDLEPLLAEGGLFFVEGPLEDNRSLVLLAARLFGSLKKMRGRPLHGDLPPFHLFRATARAQRAFFEQGLGYEVKAFKVWESGWPYRNPGDRLLHPGSAGGFVRQAIGLAAIGAGKALSGAPLRVGNRFSALLAPEPYGASPIISAR
jgi:SAM-dependent methyltransferase